MMRSACSFPAMACGVIELHNVHISVVTPVHIMLTSLRLLISQLADQDVQIKLLFCLTLASPSFFHGCMHALRVYIIL